MVSENIKRVRTEKNMTQKELAEKLHVTAQAVSRWETGEVEVSINTIQEMSKIFNVSINELIDGTTPEKEIVVTKEYVVKDSKPVLAVCEECNKPIYKGEDIVRIPHRDMRRHTTYSVRCKECDRKIKKAAYEKAVAYGVSQRKKSFIWGSVAALIGILLTVLVATSTETESGFVAFGIVVSVLFFPFISCLILQNNFVGEMFESICDWGFVNMPGVIFDLDLDGIIWLITVKLFLWVLGILLAVITFLLGVMVGLVVSIFAYPFAISKSVKHPELSNDD